MTTTCKNDCTNYQKCADQPNTSNFKYYHMSTVVHLSCLGFTKKDPKTGCQACEKAPEMWRIEDIYTDKKYPPYCVCSNCLPMLTMYSLTKKQFKNLLKNGHTATEFLLHEDFYDEEGKALQPMLGR